MEAEPHLQKGALCGYATAALWAASVLAIVCLSLGVRSLEISSFPSSMESEWEAAWAIGITASLIALLGLSLSKSSHCKRFGSLALGCSMVGCWLPLTSYYQVNHTYIWPLIGVLGMVMIVGASLCGLRMVPAATSCFLTFGSLESFSRLPRLFQLSSSQTEFGAS